jgi:4-alpha-glucanotransferase
VHYPAADLLGVLALESGRARALVIGEDLGTVAPGVREQLAAERVLSYRLAWFERDAGGRRRAADYPRLALTAATTHDLPTVTGFFSGEDLARLHDIGVVSDADLAGATASQRADREELIVLLIAEGVLAPEHAGDLDELRVALYAFLARTPSMLVAATLEDAVGTSDRPNVPGTVDQYPNWSLPLPVLLDDLAADPRVRRLAAVLAAERPPPAPR